MRFCKDCGGVLNLFGNSDHELCSTCIQEQKRHAPISRTAVVSGENQELLKDAVLLYQEGKVVLRSKEGWELWSAPGTSQTTLRTILNRARRIYEIRLKRLKN